MDEQKGDLSLLRKLERWNSPTRKTSAGVMGPLNLGIIV
jgi:hypothetical protein